MNATARLFGRTSSVLRQPHSGMRIHLLGAGSSGSLLAVHLQNAIEHLNKSHSITLQLRRPPKDKEAPVKLTLIDPDQFGQRSATFPWQITSDRQTESDEEPIDVVLVTTKADQTISALQPLIGRLTSPSRASSATMFLMQNGMGLDEEIAKAFQWDLTADSAQVPYIMMGVNGNGTWTKERFETVHAVRATLQLGLSSLTEKRIGQASAEQLMSGGQAPTQLRESSLAQVLDLVQSAAFVESLGVSCTASSRDFSIAQQRKLVVNCAMNPITALYDIQNGRLLAEPRAMEEVDEIIAECAHIIGARHAQLYGPTAQLPDALTHDELRSHVMRMIGITSANWSSMMQDMWTARGSTEVSFLNGTIVRWANELGMPATKNRDLVERVNDKAQRIHAEKTRAPE